MNDLHDALRRTAESAPLRSVDLGVIRARAASIRRRRASVAVGGSIAAVAVVAGLGLALAPGGADHAVPPIASTPAVPTPSGSPTSTPSDGLPQFPTGTVFPVTTEHPTAEGTTGEELHVPYWADGELNAPDGSQSPLTSRPDALALDAQGDWWVVTGGDATQLVQLSPDGRAKTAPVDSMPEALAAAPGREATISRSAGGWVLTTNDRVFHLANVTDTARVDGFLANGDVAFTADGVHEQVARVAADTTEPLPGAVQARASSTGLLALAGDDGTWKVQDGDGHDVWSVSWAGVGGFSDDGKYVALVGDPQHLVPGSEEVDSDGAVGTLWIRTAADDGAVSVFTAPKGGFFGPWTWEGDDIVAEVFERDSAAGTQGTWTLVRLAPDGYKLVRSASWPGRIDQPPYVFGAGVMPTP